MKIKTFKEILSDYKNVTDHWADQDYDEDNIIEAVKVFVSQLIMTDDEIEQEADNHMQSLSWEYALRWYRDQIKNSLK
jgi:hypothetical protein